MEPFIIKKRNIFTLFQMSLIIKEMGAIFEVLGGILIWFTSKVTLVTFLLNFFQNFMTDGPKDYLSFFIVNSAAELAVSSQYFLGAYLFIHGLIKIILIVNLLKKKLWVYPISIVVFSLFIFYQLYNFYLAHSFWTLTLTLFDMLVVYLVIYEYGILRKARHRAQHQ